MLSLALVCCLATGMLRRPMLSSLLPPQSFTGTLSFVGISLLSPAPTVAFSRLRSWFRRLCLVFWFIAPGWTRLLPLFVFLAPLFLCLPLLYPLMLLALTLLSQPLQGLTLTMVFGIFPAVPFFLC